MATGDLERQLHELLRYPREDLDIEVKGWLDLTDKIQAADLVQAILALANHGGGYIVVGFVEVGGVWSEAPERLSDLSGYRQDAINGWVQRYAEPAFQCQAYRVVHPDTGAEYPVIVVPGGHTTPIRARADDPERKHVRANTYYIRRPGPCSEPPRSGSEWDELIRRCVRNARDDLLGEIRQIFYGHAASTRTGASSPSAEEVLDEWERASRQRFDELVQTDLPDEQPSRYAYGVWTAAYELNGPLKRIGRQSLLNILARVKTVTGWPPWWIPTRPEIKPRPVGEVIECWLAETRT
jgi:hypothetical protein